MTERAADLRDSLVELDRLRRREVLRRRESESMLQALKVLADQSDDLQLPAAMLAALRDMFALDGAAILKDIGAIGLSSAQVPETRAIQALPERTCFAVWRTLPEFKSYISKNPRLIPDSRKVPALAERLENHGSYMLGGLNVSEDRALMVVYRAAARDSFSPDELGLFRRILPLVEQALVRQRERIVRDRLEHELREKQKMESLGTLAGGIAHEINTPLQYVTSNLSYLDEAARKLLAFAENLKKLAEYPPRTQGLHDQIEHLNDLWEEIDGDFLREDLPDAFEQSRDGLDRISRIVQAIREFSHPSSDQEGDIDLNHEVETALIIAGNQWKHIAESTTDLDPSCPQILGASDNIRQALVNLLVNAAHAIEDRLASGDKTPGLIRIGTRVSDDSVIVSVSDNGIGMSEDVRHKIFDLFFTTKAPGRGTGQGLALCYTMIQNLGGRIDVKTEEGKGSCFYLHLPLKTCGTEAA
ncbi:hypothetical protein GCM10011316_22070 [Roseibium aquae]|uniref:histidine kinase n=1 Tax=Roseibium aquae TaxID=1323746 RepID=A0A916TJT0_9HYPH|nr:ATP-binding protein [Roseibium aquae]GGB49523.1 hypothetical protein GCM10011316_22070 [Roseibium aquae]